MQDSPNITKGPGIDMLRGTGMVIAGFVSMVAGLCLGSYIADARSDRTVIHGTRREMVIRLTQIGPKPLRQAAMSALADGVLTVREERHLYMIADEIRLAEAKARRMKEESDMPNSRRPGTGQMI